MQTKTLILVSLLLTVGLAPAVLAHPADDFNFFSWPAPYFGFFTTPGVMYLGSFTIDGVTSDTNMGWVQGAGSCAANAGEACITVPVFNAFTSTAVEVVECEITGFSGPWFGTPAIHLVQDVDNNRVLEDWILGGDVVAGGIGVAYGSPSGPLTGGPAGGEFFNTVGGPLVSGVPIHVVLEESFTPPHPLRGLLSATFDCWAF